jgi:NAD+ kinase
MLRALRTYLGSGIPVIGVNFGRVGFLSSMQPDELEVGLTRAFRGELEIVELPTLEVENGETGHVAVNDVVVTSAVLGRMVELEWAVGGEDLGSVPCDGIICSTPSGSTAYNLSNGGPVLMWGIDAMATTFVAPHSLHARPLVVPRGKDVVVWNRTAEVPVAVLVAGHRVGEAGPGGRVAVRLGAARTLLGTLPDATFVSRYRESFST